MILESSQPIYPRPPGARKKGITDLKSQEVVYTPASHGYFQSFDGTRLFFSREGRGRPLVFCYGLVCSSLHWTYQIDYFKNTYEAIWFDYRGHQNSAVPTNLKTLTIPNIAEDLACLLQDLNIEKPVLLGHSMGVNVILEYYRKYPENVSAMILANGTAQRPLETLFRHNALQAGFRILKKMYETSPSTVTKILKMQKSNPIARTLVALGGFNPHLTPQADIDLYVKQVSEMDPAILLHLIENYDAFDSTDWLHQIHIPTLILSGEQDRIIPLEQQQLMKQLIPQSQHIFIHHGSHCPQMDLPDVVNFKIEKFLKEINYVPIPTPTTESANRSTD